MTDSAIIMISMAYVAPCETFRFAWRNGNTPLELDHGAELHGPHPEVRSEASRLEG
jgi:hypothetical protein